MSRSPIWFAFSTFAVLTMLFALAATTPAHAQTFTVIHDFGKGTDGAQPNGAIYEDSAGSIYGATSGGGTTNGGVIYQIDQNGNVTILHNFDPIQGNSPNAGLSFFNGTWLFGVSSSGGANSKGSVFAQQLSPPAFKNVHSFDGTDGESPVGTLVLAADGSGAYGVTSYGGGVRNGGVVYKIDKSGNVTVIYSFMGGSDGKFPSAGLLLDSKGNLYGVTADGGFGFVGVFFRIDPSGTESLIYSFDVGDGANPNSTPVADGTGDAYGTTPFGGRSQDGEVYKLNLSTGNEAIVHYFTGDAFGATPAGNLAKDGRGHLYGVTAAGGDSSCSCGVVYQMNAAGTEAVLHTFTGGDGANPNWLYRDPGTGILYGTTTGGGTYGKGVLFRITP
jgi:uncharacterized repeat protein (TIGR03803 family)